MWKYLISLFTVSSIAHSAQLLTDPILQNPSSNSANVVWFTEFLGKEHYVEYGNELEKRADSQTTKLSRMREDMPAGGCQERCIYRHEAHVTDLVSRTPYRAVSIASEIDIARSSIFSCAPAPQRGAALKILFSSDHQVGPMVAANLQKVKEAIGDIDAIFFAGDIVNHPDRASEWFDDPSGSGFFPCFQGKGHRQIGDKIYIGAPLLQYAPIFSAIGNHEVMGRWTMEKSLNMQFNDPYPLEQAKIAYGRSFPENGDLLHKENWVRDHSFNSDSYEEIFTFPQSPCGGKKYYAVSFGDIRLVVLYATRIWRSQLPQLTGKYTESADSFDAPSKWGYGDFIFEPIEKGSAQYQWLEKELQSDAFQTAKYKIVMLHNPLHSLGGNAIPPYAHPQQEIERNAQGKITAIRYRYPKDQDVLIRDVEPLLIQYGAQMVLCGHSHLWNRFQSEQGVHYLETSNVGNSFGAYLHEKRNLMPEGGDENYVGLGDPYGLTPVIPSIAPLHDANNEPLPYIASNEITVFSIFSTDTGAVDSYYFDTAHPESPVVHFDRFFLYCGSL